MAAPGVSDLGWNAELFSHDGSAAGDANRRAVGVAQFVGLAGAENFADPVDQARCYGAEGLFVMMAFADHQAPIYRSQFRIDAPCGISCEVEGSLDPVITRLSDRLTGLVGAAGGIGSREHSAEAS